MYANLFTGEPIARGIYRKGDPKDPIGESQKMTTHQLTISESDAVLRPYTWQENPYTPYRRLAYCHPALGGTAYSALYAVQETDEGYFIIKAYIQYAPHEVWSEFASDNWLWTPDSIYTSLETAQDAVAESVKHIIEMIANEWRALPVTPPAKRKNNPMFSSKASFQTGLYRARRAYKNMLSAMRKQYRAEKIEETLLTLDDTFRFEAIVYRAAQVRFFDLANMWRMNINLGDDGNLDIALRTFTSHHRRPAPAGIIARIAAAPAWMRDYAPKTDAKRRETYHILKEIYTYA